MLPLYLQGCRFAFKLERAIHWSLGHQVQSRDLGLVLG